VGSRNSVLVASVRLEPPFVTNWLPCSGRIEHALSGKACQWFPPPTEEALRSLTSGGGNRIERGEAGTVEAALRVGERCGRRCAMLAGPLRSALIARNQIVSVGLQLHSVGRL